MPVGSSAGCVCCKACAGHFVCWLFATRPVPVSFATGPFCYNGLVLPCHALSACLCLDPMPASPFCSFASIHYHVRQNHRACCRDCPVGSRITGLHWRPVHRVVCIHPSIHPPFIACVSLSQHHSLCRRDCPVGSRTRRLHLCSPCTACVHCAHFKGEA